MRGDDPNSEPICGLAYNQLVAAIEYRLVTNVAIMGYSWGGGATYNLSAALDDNVNGSGTDITKSFTLALTGYIDAVLDNGSGVGETRRPPLTTFHTAQYTSKLTYGVLRYGYPSDGDDDIDREYRGVDHLTIDDDAVVQSLLVTRIEQKVPAN